MLKTLLHIGTFDKGNADGGTLLIEIGETYCLLSCLGDDIHTVQVVKVFTFEKADLGESTRQILEEVKRSGQIFKKVIISPAFPQTLQVPGKLFRKDSSLLGATFGTKDAHQMYDEVSEWQLTNWYTLPHPVYDMIVAGYPSATYVHAYTPFLKIPAGYDREDQIAVHFIHNVFRVLVIKNGQLQLVQSYSYSSPADVLYYLLKICREFSLQPDQTHLILSGWVDEASALYKELNSYFLQIHFAKAKMSGLSFAGNHLPEHYFVSLYNLAQCAL